MPTLLMSKSQIFIKYDELKRILASLRSVAVAFSGGVDSSLLLHAAIESLGQNNVMAIHGRSCLSHTEMDVQKFYEKNFNNHDNLIIVELDPLEWPEFVKSSNRRCYHCKKRTYLAFLDALSSDERFILVDGTNVDDLQDTRPGLKVLEELNVRSPLVEADLAKKEIRFLALYFALENHNMPSNSCLATRLFAMPLLESSDLARVERVEKTLKKMGFYGCRAKPIDSNIVIEIRQQDFMKISQRHSRLALEKITRFYGFEKIFLDLKGRN